MSVENNNPYAAKAVEAESVEETVPVVEKDSVPAGTVTEILNWVGDDSEKAQLALDEENSHETPRKSLVNNLKDILKK